MSSERPAQRRSRGISMIELIIFIVIVGVGMAGLTTILSNVVLGSAEPMVNKQMLAIAEALLEEVSAQPFTYCDPTDANASADTTISTANCATTVQGLGPTTGQTRSGANPFNNVPDYSGLAPLNPVTDISGTHSYAGYRATITLTAGDALGPAGATIAPNDNTAANLNLLRVGVTVTNPGGQSITVEGYRARHSPIAVP